LKFGKNGKNKIRKIGWLSGNFTAVFLISIQSDPYKKLI